MTKPQWALVTTSQQSSSISAAFGVVTLSAALWLWVSTSNSLFLRPYLWCLQGRHTVCRTVAVGVRQRCCISQAVLPMPSESSVSAALWPWVSASDAVFLGPYLCWFHRRVSCCELCPVAGCCGGVRPLSLVQEANGIVRKIDIFKTILSSAISGGAVWREKRWLFPDASPNRKENKTLIRREGEPIFLAYADGYWEEGNQPLFLVTTGRMSSEEEVHEFSET
jgi:hypothetical protein